MCLLTRMFFIQWYPIIRTTFTMCILINWATTESFFSTFFTFNFHILFLNLLRIYSLFFLQPQREIFSHAFNLSPLRIMGPCGHDRSMITFDNILSFIIIYFLLNKCEYLNYLIYISILKVLFLFE